MGDQVSGQRHRDAMHAADFGFDAIDERAAGEDAHGNAIRCRGNGKGIFAGSAHKKFGGEVAPSPSLG
jgi:hypothetical protein